MGSAGILLQGALGINDDELSYLRKVNLLSDDDYFSDKKWEEKDDDDDDDDRGCWTSRLVDSVVFVVVDALRFDFARDRLPSSIGSRLFPSEEKADDEEEKRRRRRGEGMSKLVRFVADPPTVTMQRLKGLTTGGLPTFADITGSFGGANVDEDSWVEQIATAPWGRRRHNRVGHHHERRRTTSSGQPQIAFVGDDTWIDLFPTQFNDAHPFPSFNTRDLDSVDDGCLVHIPRLLDGLVGMKRQQPTTNAMMMNDNDNDDNTTSFELIVAHFLGVDHVGHTYGPNDPHMERKLQQMDTALGDILDRIDDAPQESCIVALVLGDHGMTEDGNHGGGTDNEVNAGLFAHYSHGCGNDDDDDEDDMNSATTTTQRRTKGEEIGSHAARVFDTIHQIDLVPTISILLGLPIPYANIGGLVPNLLPSRRNRHNHRLSTTTTTTSSHIATALALNAAQVWNYLYTYSKTSNDLPSSRMRELKEILDSATLVYRDAISQSRKHSKEEEDLKDDQTTFDSTAYRQACGMYKLFLAESTDLGKQVWTQFNEGGMKVGIGIMILAWIMTCPLWRKNVRDELFGMMRFDDDVIKKSKQSDDGISINDKSNASIPSWNLRWAEIIATMAFMIFHCMMLTFSNSYIEHEKEIVGFFLSVLCLLVCRRWVGMKSSMMYLSLVVAICSRTNDIFVTGHGLDPSIRLHAAHHPAVFLSSLLMLAVLRILWLEFSSKKPIVDRSSGITSIPMSIVIDIIVIVGLACTWWEKRSHDHSRTGFISARIALVAIIVGILQSVHSLCSKQKSFESNNVHGCHHPDSSIIGVEKAQLAIFRALLFLIFVTGPAMASTAVLIVIQCAALRRMMMMMMETTTNANEISAPTMAALWRLAIRYFFFATNHQCSFNRLQFSAAFVATNTFQFHLSGVSLFMNTFGCEILGSCMVLLYSQSCYCSSTIRRSSSAAAANYNVWQWFIYYQWTEMLSSCISVSLMKRHLMVWAIFAPRFMFAAVFTAVAYPLWVINTII